MKNYSKALERLDRLQTMRDLALLNNEQVKVYDMLTLLASNIIGVPVSLMSIVAADYQFFKSHVGLPDPWNSRRSTPLSHSFCQHVVVSNQPLVVTDARENPLVKTNLAIRDLNVIGYLGIPLTLQDGTSLGSFCVIDDQPREWDAIEIDIMKELAALATQEFELRVAIRHGSKSQNTLTGFQNQVIDIIQQLRDETDKRAFLARLRQLRQEHDL